VLWGVSLKSERGHLTAIVGANGAGKTTMLRAIAGTITPWGGRVTFGGEDVTRVATHVKAAQGLALVPEGRQLFSAMTVSDNLDLGAFSGGEQQMLAIARGLMSDPKILIIDEMSLGLSPVLTYQLFLTLKKLKQEGL